MRFLPRDQFRKLASCLLQVRRRARQASKVGDATEQSLALKIDMVSLESQAEKLWRDRLLSVTEQGWC